MACRSKDLWFETTFKIQGNLWQKNWHFRKLKSSLYVLILARGCSDNSKLLLSTTKIILIKTWLHSSIESGNFNIILYSNFQETNKNIHQS